MKMVLLTQTAIADYRNHFVHLLLQRYPGLRVQVGMVYFEESTRTTPIVVGIKEVAIVKNLFSPKRRLCWQMFHWQDVVSAHVVIAELNPRLLSTWVILFMRLVLRKRTVLWGHAWSRGGARTRSEPLRHLMRKLSTGLIFYTNQQRTEFLVKYPSFEPPVWVAPNSLYLAEDMESVRGPLTPQDFIYVGRLVAGKKVHVLLEAFRRFVESNPQSRLHIVGSGDELPALLSRVSSDKITNVMFHGHISDIARLKNLYATSVASVSPGYVGLSVTQSFSFGVPMIISRTEPHSPEIESFIDGVNGSYFTTDDPESLCGAMKDWHARREFLSEIAETIVAGCREHYSVERMVAGFGSAING